jgi:hypothetical protein
VDGPFKLWVARIAAAAIKATDTDVSYAAPGVGQVAFGWEGSFRVDGKVVPQSDHPRFDNPYAKVPYGRPRYELAHAGYRLLIDFTRDLHQETFPRPPRNGAVPRSRSTATRGVSHALAR